MDIYHLPVQPVPVIYHPQQEKSVPYIWSESPLFKFRSIAPCSITTGPGALGLAWCTKQPSWNVLLHKERSAIKWDMFGVFYYVLSSVVAAVGNWHSVLSLFLPRVPLPGGSRKVDVKSNSCSGSWHREHHTAVWRPSYSREN